MFGTARADESIFSTVNFIKSKYISSTFDENVESR